MKLGIISDSHDRIDRVGAALDLFRAHQVERLIHCGDITGADAVRAFTGWQVDFVLGNCDWQPARLAEAIIQVGCVLHDRFGELEIADQQIAWIHSDNAELFNALENANHYDYLFYGHTHEAEQHRTGKTTVCNPGALHRVKTPSCAILDVANNSIETVYLGGMFPCHSTRAPVNPQPPTC